MPQYGSPVRHSPDFRSLAVFTGFVSVLWIAGGASRADVSGQILVRAVAWVMLAVAIVLLPPPRRRTVGAVGIFLLLAACLVGIQLIPVPPRLWSAMPGRAILAQSPVFSDANAPWRPLSISPGATINALSSLIVPIATLFLTAPISRAGQRWILNILLAAIVAGTILGLLQFSGGHVTNPFINDVSGMVSGNFANRNHFALFVAIGCLLLPAWAFEGSRTRRWPMLAAFGTLVFFGLVILGTGSRAGMLVGAIGTALGLFITRKRITHELRRLPRKVALGLLMSSAAAVAILVTASIALQRAASINRVIELDPGADLRGRALPTLWYMAGQYFPVGAGFGTFDPSYRIYEPDKLLNYLYFNHAHDDLLEVVLDGGLLAALLLAAAVAWWARKTFRAWRKAGSESRGIFARLGSGVLLLVIVASAFDYPARTPMIMTVVIIAAIWLNDRFEGDAVGPNAKVSTERRPHRPLGKG